MRPFQLKYLQERYSSDFSRHEKHLHVCFWYDIHPYSLAVWPHYYSESIRRGRWWQSRGVYPFLALDLLEEGEIVFSQAGESATVKAGELYLSHPGFYTTLASGKSEFSHRLQLIISGGLVKMLLRNIGLEKCRHLRFSSQDELNPIRSLMLSIADRMRDKAPGDAMKNALGCQELLLTLAEKFNRNNRREMPAILTHALIYMEQDRKCSCSIETLADRLGCGTTTLRRLFHDYLDHSPQQYWNNLRMEHAVQMVAGSPLSLKEISRELGFQNSLYFSSAFKKHTGVSPRLFRKQAQEATPSLT